MEILGYSERGMINSLFYEMKFSQNNLQLFSDFLSLFSFPYRAVNFQISDAKILIEQSFSDFGDADAVVLVENKSWKQAMFIEAKVRAFKNWQILIEFEKFTKTSEKIREKIKRNEDAQEIKRKLTSNLFMQLYLKTRMVKTLQKSDVAQLQEGIQFPKVSSKEYRKIGNNKVVLKAVNQLKGYCKDALFIALVPDDVSNLRNFYQGALKDYSPEGFQEWDIRNWGYVTWAQVEEFCKRYDLKVASKTFEFNDGQIYEKR